MKILALLLCPLATLAQKPIDVLHYNYTVSLTDSGNTINCSALISFKSANKQAAFDLVDNMKVSAVWNGKTNKPLQFTHLHDKLNIDLAGESSSEIIVGVNYSGVPKDGLIISKNKFGQRTFFSDHWPNRAHQWLVCVDHPSDKATVEFTVKAPVQYQVVSNGVQIEETNIDNKYKLTHWLQHVAIPVKVMCLGISEFAMTYAGNVDNIPVYTWVFPANREQGFKDYSEAIEILPFFIKHIAPYPFKQLSDIQSKTIFGGMENAGAIFYSEKSVTGNKKAGQLIAHEIAHQWFGNMVTEADWPHLWLSEGFATYMELMYIEYRYGHDTLNRELKANREKVIEFSREYFKPVVDTTLRDYMKLLNANSYEKGAWVLHMLRRQIGDSLFWKGLRKYYADYAGKNAVTDDFRKTMEDVSGRDLKSFFKQWIYTAGHPVLKIDHKYDGVAKSLKVTIIQEQAIPFEFPLAIQIIGMGDETITKSLRIKDKQTEFTVSLNAAPLRLVPDPNNNLLFEMK